MKSFDILVDGRLIQSDLIVVNLPVRNDIAAYYRLDLDSKLINHIIAEKAVSPAENTGGIALNASADNVVAKYEIVDAYPIVLDATAEFNALFPFSMEENSVEIQQELREVSQKIERTSLPISIGADDMLIIMPLKSTGIIEHSVALDVDASEIKNAIIDGENSYGGLAMDTTLADPLVTYYANAESGLSPGVDVRSLSFLLHLRLVQSSVNIGVNSIDFDLYRSLGKLPARIAIGSDAPFVVEFFEKAENTTELRSSAEGCARKLINLEPGVALACTGSAILRRMNLLSDVDALGTLADIDDMKFDDLYYSVIEE